MRDLLLQMLHEAWSVCLSVYLFVCMSVCLSLCVSVIRMCCAKTAEPIEMSSGGQRNHVLDGVEMSGMTHEKRHFGGVWTTERH